MIFAKKGLPPEFPALSGVVIRVIVATIFVWVFAFLSKNAISNIKRIKENKQALKFTMLGALIGPLMGVWLSLVAVQLAKVGIASTLMSLTPIFHLPIGKFLKEKISHQAIFGTIIALVGVAIIFF